jgi:phthiocerol/phenolphthiocerol synthesis type-I polyketide synthase C
LSVQWGPFAEIGLAAQDAHRGARLEERGMGSIAEQEAWPALARMLQDPRPVIGYVPIDLRRWFDAYPDTAALPCWEGLYAAARDGVDPAASANDFQASVLEAPPEARSALVEAKVRELSSRVLRLDPDRVEHETPFKELGLDSLMGLELRNRLESAFALKLSPTLLWTYGNPRALAGALCDQLAAVS